VDEPGACYRPRRRDDADPEPPIHNGQADDRSLRRCRGDVAARLDDPVSAGNRRAERAGTGDRGGGLRLGRPARGNRACKPDIALQFDFATWAWFISVGAVGAKLVAFALQYGVFRTIIRQRIAPSVA